jgi:hypothetical protein
METSILRDYRCDCGKLLFRGMLLTCQIEIKCKRCGAIKIMHGILDQPRALGRYALLLDKSGRIAQSDNSASVALAYSQGELLAKHIYQIDPFLRPSVYKKLWDTAKNEGDSFALESVQRKKNGDVLSVKISFRFLFIKGEKHALMNVAASNTLQKETDTHTIPQPASPAHAQFSAELNMHGIFTYVYGTITHLCGITNLSESHNFLGYASSEMLGKHIQEFLSNEQKESYVKRILDHSPSRQPFQISRAHALCKNGQPALIESHFIPRLSDTHAFQGYHSTHFLIQ